MSTLSRIHRQPHATPSFLRKSGGQLTGDLWLSNAAGPTLLNEAASSINPTVIPNRADPDTGIAWKSSDILAITSGGVEIVEFRSTSASTVNSWQFSGATSSNKPTLLAVGTDANISLVISAKAAGVTEICGGDGASIGFSVSRVSSATRIAFFGAGASIKATISGARNDPEAALADLLAELATKGLITNSTTAS